MGPGSAERPFAPHRVRGTRHYPFFGTTRKVALARAITTSSALARHCAKQIVLPVLITSLSIASHWPIAAEPTKSTDSPAGHFKFLRVWSVKFLHPRGRT